MPDSAHSSFEYGWQQQEAGGKSRVRRLECRGPECLGPHSDGTETARLAGSVEADKECRGPAAATARGTVAGGDSSIMLQRLAE
jgi:hypothetical protein